jgi:hypothetical protein
MAVLRGHVPADRFTIIANDWVRDPEMKLKARGLLVYIASHRIGYKLTVAQMVAECADGKDAVYGAIGELKTLGYLRAVRRRGDGGVLGEVDYELVDPTAGTGIEREDVGESATSGKSRSGETSSGSAKSGESASKKTTPKKTRDKNTIPADAGAARPKRGTRIDPDWLPSVEAADAMASKLGVTRAQLGAWTEEFRDHFTGTGRPMVDWLATWRNWMRREARGGVRPVRPIGGGRSNDPAMDVLQRELQRHREGDSSPLAVAR